MLERQVRDFNFLSLCDRLKVARDSLKSPNWEVESNSSLESGLALVICLRVEEVTFEIPKDRSQEAFKLLPRTPGTLSLGALSLLRCVDVPASQVQRLANPRLAQPLAMWGPRHGREERSQDSMQICEQNRHYYSNLLNFRVVCYTVS